ncbi:hypothetical protein HYC85_026902 [Camellia sinensis]|uniref:CASP-like protein n=1 Tax=Camellia sinensis TaxID=4442 RepID=A0A7J7G4V2_CAMSI|nr:hypothetical protein HYC85_026902 [Camellia sinensis]
MDVEAKIKPNPTLNTSTPSLKTQICLKFLATMSSLSALCIIFTSKQTIMLYGLQIDAKYSDDSSFKFLAAANVIVCVFSVTSAIGNVSCGTVIPSHSGSPTSP